MLVLRREPAQFGYASSRWKQEMLLESCAWLRLETCAGLSRLLKRLKISYKRGREYLHSPDPDFAAKLEQIASAYAQAQAAPQRFGLYYLDEVTYYRQPSLARAYEAQGPQQALARRSYRSNSTFRIVGALNALTGQICFAQSRHTDTACLAAFWVQLRQTQPEAERLYVVLDNWPLHFHPDVLAPLQPQHFPFPQHIPRTWPTSPSKHAHQDNLPIQLLCLPTYASWLNPIEKLWRWLKQEILHLHRQSDAWPELQQRVETFLNAFSAGSDDLLRYVGLLPN